MSTFDTLPVAVAQTLRVQESRIRSARRMLRHADRAHAIGLEHSRAVNLCDEEERAALAGRAFDLARTLYRRAERTLNP